VHADGISYYRPTVVAIVDFYDVKYDVHANKTKVMKFALSALFIEIADKGEDRQEGIACTGHIGHSSLILDVYIVLE